MTLNKRKKTRDHQISVRLTTEELEVLEELAKFGNRTTSDLLRICFIREARLRLPSKALKSLLIS